MSSDRNKIAQELTVEQLSQFVSELVAMPGKQRTLAAIQHKAAELGITISLMSARAFRETTFERHLANLRNAQQIASEVEAIETGGNTLADASAKLLSKRIFNQLLEAEDEDGAGEVDLESMTLAVARLRSGNVQQRALEAKLRELERKDRERDERKAALQKTVADAKGKAGSVRKETLQQIETELQLL